MEEVIWISPFVNNSGSLSITHHLHPPLSLLCEGRVWGANKTTSQRGCMGWIGGWKVAWGLGVGWGFGNGSAWLYGGCMG